MQLKKSDGLPADDNTNYYILQYNIIIKDPFLYVIQNLMELNEVVLITFTLYGSWVEAGKGNNLFSLW